MAAAAGATAVTRPGKGGVPTLTVAEPNQWYPALPYPLMGGVVAAWPVATSGSQAAFRLTLTCTDAGGADCTASQLQIAGRTTNTHEGTLDQINALLAQNNVMLLPPPADSVAANEVVGALTAPSGRAPLPTYTLTVDVQNLTDQTRVDPPARLTMTQRGDGNAVTQRAGATQALLGLVGLFGLVLLGILVVAWWRWRRRRRQRQQGQAAAVGAPPR